MDTPVYTATISRNADLEYVVRFKRNGQPLGEDSTYYTTDPEDALATKEASLASMNGNVS